MMALLTDLLNITKLLTNLQDKLRAAADGLKDITQKHEALDKRVYSLEERGKLERELGDRARIDRLIEHVGRLEAQVSMLSQLNAQRLTTYPAQEIHILQPAQQLPHRPNG